MDMKHLFICGAGRSGTTFLWKILNKSPSVNLATEIHYFSSLYHNGFLRNFKKLRHKTNRVKLDNVIDCITRGNHFGMYWEKNRYFPQQEIRNYFINRSLNDKTIYEYLIQHDLLASGKNHTRIKYVGEKTPLNIFHTKRLFKWFPDATMLFIFRNPIDVLRSEVNKKNKPAYPLRKGNLFYSCGLMIFVFFEWLLVAVIALYNKAIHKKKFIVISYEYLTSRQESTVYGICSAIGIEYSLDLCEFKKIGSSYSASGEKSYWYPAKWIVLLYTVFLNPVRRILNRVSLNAKHIPSLNSL